MIISDKNSVAECIEKSKSLSIVHLCDEFKLPLITFLILCPSAEDAQLADIPDNFGTWIILPEDKIAESGLTKNAAIYRTVDMTTNIIPLMKKGDNLIRMDFADVTEMIRNRGRACIGFGENLEKSFEVAATYETAADGVAAFVFATDFNSAQPNISNKFPPPAIIELRDPNIINEILNL